MSKLKSHSRRRAQRGQSMVEYMILTALIAVAGITMVQAIGFNLNTKLATIANTLNGDAPTQAYQGRTINGQTLKERTLENFVGAPSSPNQ